jgi:hypothetical protein
MNKDRAALSGAVALFVFAACWGEFSFAQNALCDQHQRQHCNGNHCDLQITVTSCSADGIMVEEADLHLCTRDGPKTINWKLPEGGAFRFRDDGIDFKNLPNTEDFDPATKQKGPFKYSWDNKLRNGGRQFEYSIKLVSSSGQSCDKDPRISND